MDDDTPVPIHLIGLVAMIWALLWGMVFMTHTASVFSADARCRARGFAHDEIIVHYPDFWNVDTICYDGEQSKGVKL